MSTPGGRPAPASGAARRRSSRFDRRRVPRRGQGDRGGEVGAGLVDESGQRLVVHDGRDARAESVRPGTAAAGPASTPDGPGPATATRPRRSRRSRRPGVPRTAARRGPSDPAGRTGGCPSAARPSRPASSGRAGPRPARRPVASASRYAVALIGVIHRRHPIARRCRASRWCVEVVSVILRCRGGTECNP